jgi:hypothetical protein
MEENFLNGESCDRCGGPILAEGHEVTEFKEETLDYITQMKWPCYACGHLNTCQSQPLYTF